MNQTSRTVEEYRQAIKNLKKKCQQIQNSNEILQKQLGIPETLQLRTPNFQEIFQKFQSEIDIKREILIELNKCCQERGMTIEMLFRCSDREFKNQVTPEQLTIFLRGFFSDRVETSILLKIALLFDEDHSGLISRKEFYRSVIFCQVNGELHPEVMLDGPIKINTENKLEDELKYENIQQKVLSKLVRFFKQQNLSAQEIYLQIDQQNKGYICYGDMQGYLGQNNFDSNEITTIMRLFDSKQNDRIEKAEAEKNIIQILQSQSGIKGIIRMQTRNPGMVSIARLEQFSSTLKNFKIDPLLVYYQCPPKNTNYKKYDDLAKLFQEKLRGKTSEFSNQQVQQLNHKLQIQIIEFLQMIDTSGDGFIDLDEFRMAMITEQDLNSLRRNNSLVEQQKVQNSTLKSDNDEKKKKFINLVHQKIKQQNISMESFFDWMDREKTGKINLVDLRRGLMALNISISDALKILQAFDINQDGVIELQEFIESFGQEYKDISIDAMVRRAVKKLEDLFRINKLDFVEGMNNLLFKFTKDQNDPIICLEELLYALDKIKKKADLKDNEIENLLEAADRDYKNQIHLIPFCNYLYQLLHPEVLQKQKI